MGCLIGGCVATTPCPAGGANLACRVAHSDRSAYLPYAKQLDSDIAGPRDCRRAAIYYRAAANGSDGAIHVWTPRYGGVPGRVESVRTSSQTDASSEAKYRLGQLYRTGCGVAHDDKRGDQLILQALREGYVPTPSDIDAAYLKAGRFNPALAASRFRQRVCSQGDQRSRSAESRYSAKIGMPS